MRISPERQQSRIRITKVELKIAEVLKDETASDDEILMALINTLSSLQNQTIINHTPLD